MRQRLVNSQLNNYATYLLYLRKMLILAENVFIYEDMPESIDLSYMNGALIRQGSVAFFYDDVLERLLALPWSSMGLKDCYGNPTKIEVFGENGYHRVLTKDEFVIMYDNTSKAPIYLDIAQSAERMALIKRTTDINISQQKTPRLWKTPTNKERTLQDAINNVDGMQERIITYDGVDLADTSCILEPAPYVADKLDLHKENEWSEFLQLIGITSLAIQKKERNISDEINAYLGGTIASRYSRFTTRVKAIDKINEKWNLQIKVKYYDGTPSDQDEEPIESEDEEYDVSMDNVSDMA